MRPVLSFNLTMSIPSPGWDEGEGERSEELLGASSLAAHWHYTNCLVLCAPPTRSPGVQQGPQAAHGATDTPAGKLDRLR